MTAHTFIASALLLTLVGLSGSAWAQPVDAKTKAAARKDAIEGRAAFEEGDYATAAYRFGRAWERVQVPTVGVRYARSLVQLGKLVEAATVYHQTIAFDSSTVEVDSRLQRQAQSEARTELAELSRQIPSLVIELRGGEEKALAMIELLVDGQVTPMESLSPVNVNPGKHTVQARHHTEVIVTVEVTIDKGETKTVVLRVPEEEAPQSPGPRSRRVSRKRALGVVSLSVGGAGLITGTVAGALVLAKKQELDDSGACEERSDKIVCDPSQHDLLTSYNTLRPVSTAGFAVGIVGVGVGAILLLTHRSSDKHTVSAKIGFQRVELTAAF